MKSIIVAYDKNFGIGAVNDLLWLNELPADLRHFRDLTMGSAIIMGRKTFDSIGQVLPGRHNIVISHHFKVIPGVTVARNLEEAYKVADTQDISIIGGGSIYEQTMKDADRIYATEVKAEFPQADVFFPTIDKSIWHEASRDPHTADGANKYDYDFVVFDRKH